MSEDPEQPEDETHEDVLAAESTPPEVLAEEHPAAEPAPEPELEVPVAAEPAAVAPVEPPEPEEPPAKQGEGWVETVKTIVYALLIALVIRTFLFQPFNIPSGSMEATLLVGDYVFVEKFSYGYSRASFPYRFPPFSGRVFGSAPTRGDVVVFKMPNPNDSHYMDDYIKRVIGLPGDRIQVINGIVYINDKPVPRVRAADHVETDEFGVTRNVPQYRETLPNGKSYLVLDRGASELDNTPVFLVPPGNYFMMGDNRDQSDDSRADVGYVPAEDLVGRAEMRFFSIDDSAVLFKPWTWPGAIRFSRMFTLVD